MNGLGPAPALAFTRMLWASFVASLAIYLGVLVIVAPDPEDVPQGLTMALAVVSLGSAVASVFLRRLAGEASAGRPPDLGRRRTLDLIVYALLESITVYGLVLGFLGGGMELFLPFWGVSLAGFLLVFPRAADYPDQPRVH